MAIHLTVKVYFHVVTGKIVKTKNRIQQHACNDSNLVLDYHMLQDLDIINT